MPDIVGTLKPPRLATPPSTPAVGQIYYDTATNKLYYWNGTVWVDTGGGTVDFHRYKGDWVAGSYLDGDIVVYQGYEYLAVRPTSATPAAWATGPGFGGAGLPTGAGCDWFAAAAPTGFLLCDGSAVSRTTYAPLFSVIGTTWGVGDGSSTFNLPDCRGRILVGYASGGHADVATLALNDGAVLANRRAKHNHSFAGTAGTTSTVSVDHTHAVNGTTGGRSAQHTHGMAADALAPFGAGYQWSDYNGSHNFGVPGATAGEAQEHTHTVNIQSGGISANHTHAFTPAGTVGVAGGTADTPAYVVVNRIIKT